MAFDLSEAVAQAEATLDAALAQLEAKAPAATAALPPDASPRPSRQQIVAAGEVLSGQVAKIVLLWNGKTPPPASDAPALLAPAAQAGALLCALLAGATAGGGATLRGTARSAAGEAVGAVKRCVAAAVLQGVRGDALLSAAGLVAQRCAALQSVPLDNRTALGRALTRQAVTVKDACAEVARLLPPQRPAGGGGVDEVAGALERVALARGGEDRDPWAGCQQEGGEGDEEEWDETEEELDEGEAAVAAAGCAVLGGGLALLKALAGALLRGGEPQGPALEGWESALFHVRNLAQACDELGALLYPPHDAQELNSAAAALVATAELLCEEAPAAAAGGSGGGGCAAGRQMGVARAAMEEGWGALRAALGLGAEE